MKDMRLRSRAIGSARQRLWMEAIMIRCRRAMRAALCFGVVIAAPLAAQEPPPAPPAAGEIVVSGQREKGRKEQIRQYAKTLTQAVPTSAIPLYQPDDYCPAVIGLSARTNAAIAARMRQVAAAANIAPAKLPCETSALVVFTDDTAETMKAFAREQPEYLIKITGEDIAFQGRGTPVTAWKLNARIDRNGNAANVAVGGSFHGAQIVESYTGLSRLEANSTVVVAMSVLVIEKDQVRGLTTQQIADYALMRSVSEVEPAKLAGQPVESILKVVDTKMGEETPLSLTAWDLAYVRARYSLNRLNYGPRQLADIRRRMRRSLEAGAEPASPPAR